VNDSVNIRILRELIAALDRRLPQLERADEAAIARDAAALKVMALERIAALEN
jgi:pyridoxal biosynthesis lyase PdxS